MKLRGLLVVIGTAALLLGAQPASTARADQTYNDPTGDAQSGGPDIGVVTATNVRTQIGLRVAIPNQPALAPGAIIFVAFDTDRNPATGGPDTLGADYVFAVSAEGWAFGRWNGVEFANTASNTVRVSYQNGLTLAIDRSELGNTNAFNFWVRAQSQAPGPESIDDAPNDGTWAYQLQGTGATVTSMRVFFNPYPARAGRVLTARVVSVLLSTNQRVRPSNFRCSARLGSRSLGNRCRWRIPRGARGSVRVTFTATYRGATRTSTFMVPVVRR